MAMSEAYLGIVTERANEVRLVGTETLRPLTADAAPGDVLSIAEGEVTLVARHGSALAEVYAIIDAAGLDPRFSDEVTAEVAAMLAAPGIDDAALVALDTLPFVTIDGPGTRDLDQALYLQSDRHGFRVRYAIADASYYVRPGTHLFKRALERGASYYLPGLVVPMLPRALSEGLVSLGPDGEKRAVIFDSRVRADGSVEGTRVYRARIKSHAKLTFGDVQDFLDAPETHAFASAPFADSLRVLPEVGRARLADAAMRNVVRYRREETELRLDAQREDFVVERSYRHDVELYNEQLSLLCNAEGARFVLEGTEETPYVEPIYRVHPAPESERLEKLARSIARIAELHGFDASALAFDPSTALSAYVEKLMTLRGEHARVAAAIERQAVLVNVKSSFTSAPGVHHGVGAEPYARFSAPMREIVGIYVHAEACEKIAGQPLTSFAEGVGLRDAVIASANRAKDVQRALTDQATRRMLDGLFGRDLASGDPPARSGTVMGVAAAKVYVLLDEPAIDVKIYVGDLGKVARSFLRVDEDEASLLNDKGRPVIAVGDAITLRCEGRDAVRDRFILSPTALPRIGR